MTPSTPSIIESQILVAIERLARVAVAGWVPVKTLRETLPEVPSDLDFDQAVRRLRKRRSLELWRDQWPPSSDLQSVRRL
jgi:hypothetical protein